MMADPTGGSIQDWGWYDAKIDDGENRVLLSDGRRVDICSADGPEVHRQLGSGGPISPSAASREIHCINPGQYRIELYDMEDGADLVAQREIDYIGIDREGTSLVEVESFQRGFSVMDNVVHFDRKLFSPSITPVIEPVANGEAGVTAFRFNASNTITGWDEDPRGRVSVRWTWNTEDPINRSNYTNTKDASGDLTRLHRFSPLLSPGMKTARAEFTTPFVTFSGNTDTERDSVSFFVSSSTQLCFELFILPACPSEGTCVPGLSRTEFKIRWICSDALNNQEHQFDFGDGSVTPWTTDSGDMIHDYGQPGEYLFTALVRRVGSPQDTLSHSELLTVSSVASIGVTPSTGSLQTGQTLVLTATPRDENGVVVSNETVTWTSSNASVKVTPKASNPNKANVTSQVSSTALITASIGSVSGSSSVQFSQPGTCPAISYVEIVVTDGIINVGETSDLQVIPRDASGNTLSTIGCMISWSSSSHLSVSQSGQYPYLATATGASEGTGTVTASVNGIQGSNQIIVGSPPAGDNARPYGMGNSFPPTMYQNQFYAVSVYMENIGGTTWSGPDYTLKLVSGTGFEPTSVQLPQSVAPGTNYPIGFNLYANASWGQGYNVQYQMRRAGSGTFGQTNGGWIDVLDPAGCTKNCGPTAFLGPIPESYPGGSLHGDIRPRFSSSLGSSGILQTLVVEDYPLYFFDDDGSQVAYIRYFGSLAAPWSVDVTFRVTLDPGTIHIGQLKKALSLTGYDLDILTSNASELLVKLKRQSPGNALPDERIIFLEIPLLAVPGTTPPTTLPRVELVVER
jgi:hypothetical protein